MTSNQRNLTQREIDYICNGTIAKLLGEKTASFQQKLKERRFETSNIDDLKNCLQNKIMRRWLRHINDQLIIMSCF